MRTQGEGTIQERENGKFRGKIVLDGKQIFGPTVDRKIDALPALHEKLRRLKETQEEAESETPLSLCLERKIASMVGKMSPTTVDHWRSAQKRIDGRPIGNLLPSLITAKHIDEWIAKEDGSARTKNNWINIVKQVLKEAGHPITYRPAKLRETVQHVLSDKECDELLIASSKSDLVRPIVQLALLLGLRRSEIAGLMHEDRDGDGVQIRRAVVRATGATVVKDTKTESSEAWIPLPPELDWIGSGKGYVIGDGSSPVSPSVLDDRWRRFKRDSKWSKVGLHDLRATFGMRLLASGVDVRTAAEMMRHDPQMLLKVYTRSRRDLKREAMKVATRVATPGLGLKVEPVKRHIS